MGNSKPLVSIIIPLFNSEKYICRAIDSALNQTYENIEVIVVNDGSTDRSSEIVQSYNESRIKFFNQMNQGACVARNRGIQESKGIYLKFLDADDELLLDAIEWQVKEILKLPLNYLVVGNARIDSQNKTWIQQHDFLNIEYDRGPILFLYKNVLISSTLYSKILLERVNGFDVKLPFGQETDINLRLALYGIKFKDFNKDVFVYYYLHNDKSISMQNKKKPFWAILYTIDKRMIICPQYKDYIANYALEYIASFSQTSFSQTNFLANVVVSIKPFLNNVKYEGSSFLGKLFMILSFVPFGVLRPFFKIPFFIKKIFNNK